MIKIDLDKLTNGAVITIADELGCEYEYPTLKINIFGDEIQELIKTEEGRKKADKMLEEEQIRIDREFNDYIYNVRDWLENMYGVE